MSRRKPKAGGLARNASPPTAVAAPSEPNRATDHGAAADRAETPAAFAAHRKFLLLAIAVGCAWWLALGALALFTANPVTVNPKQIALSEYVVTGRVDDATTGAVNVEKEWKHGATLGTIAVSDLERAGARNGDTYILPLVRADHDKFQITPGFDAERPPPIYPASDDAVRQLEELLPPAK